MSTNPPEYPAEPPYVDEQVAAAIHGEQVVFNFDLAPPVIHEAPQTLTE